MTSRSAVGLRPDRAAGLLAVAGAALGLVDQHRRHCVTEAITASPEAGEWRLAVASHVVERLAQP